MLEQAASAGSGISANQRGNAVDELAGILHQRASRSAFHRVRGADHVLDGGFTPGCM